ncbi:MAG: class I SAM-dependent methyltransferase [Gemmatimonadaceae bacterium]
MGRTSFSDAIGPRKETTVNTKDSAKVKLGQSPESERARPSTAEREWDADAYHRISEPQFGWGMKVLRRLELQGDERVLDVGCGSGRLTAELRERLPRGVVVATDLSLNMVAAARATLGVRFRNRCHVVNAAAQALPFYRAFDVVFSTATFHWVMDLPELFHSIFAALVPGGRLHAQCGGGWNLVALHARADTLRESSEFARFFGAWRAPWQFADDIATATRLRAAGFSNVGTSLEHAPTVFPDSVTYSEFLAKVVVRPYLIHLPDDALRTRFVSALAEQAAADTQPFSLDYWRLNLAATRPGE